MEAVNAIYGNFLIFKTLTIELMDPLIYYITFLDYLALAIRSVIILIVYSTIVYVFMVIRQRHRIPHPDFSFF